jgi:hypothetical protein
MEGPACPGVGHCVFIRGGEQSQNRQFAVAVNEVRAPIEREQPLERFPRHGPGQHIPTDDDLVDVGVPNLLEDGVEGGKVAVDVKECSYSHDSMCGRGLESGSNLDARVEFHVSLRSARNN